jgi:VCBS repeat-containing protein
LTHGTRRFALVLTGLLLTALTVALVVSAAAKPREMRVACALKKNGAMRYVSKASSCKRRRERVVRFSATGPAVATCVVRKRRRGLPVGSVRRAARCAKGGRERALALPRTVATFFCARRRGGRLRSVVRPKCRKGELPVVVSPAQGNRAPVAVDDVVAVNENGTGTIPVLANDTDADGDSLTVASLDTAATRGTATRAAAGVTYDPADRFDALAAGATETDRFRYRANDGRADSAPATVTVTVTGANDPPAVGGVEPGTLDYTAGAAAVELSGSLTVEDVDSASMRGAEVAIASGRDGGDDQLEFSAQGGITGTYDSGTGVLTLTGTATPAAYRAALRSVRFSSAVGADGGPRELTFAVEDGTSASNVAGRTVFVNHPPTDLALSHSKVVEHEPAGNPVGSLSTTDPDPGDGFGYRLVAGAGSADNAKFAIDGSTVELAADVSAGSYSIRVETNDGHGGTFEKALAIEVVGPNPAPTDIALSNADVDENLAAGAAVGNLSTTDPPGGDTHTYSLVAGPGSTDNAKFQIDGSTLETSTSLDFEAQSSHSVRIRTNDGRFAGSFEKQFAVTINDVNDPPSDLTLSNATVAENQPVGTDVGGFTTTDQESGQTHTYTLPAGQLDNDKFTITAGGLLETDEGFNFESDSTHMVRVRTTDNGVPVGNYEEDFAITVLNLNDLPVGATHAHAAVSNTGLVHDGPDPGAPPDPTGPQKTVTGNLLTGAQDEDVPAQPLTLVAATGVPTTDGGSADIQADGDFVYQPAPGAGCGADNQDSFPYTISDGVGNGQGTVTVNFGADCPWYVDNSLGAAGNGTSRTPYNSLADLDGAGGAGDADGANDTIFLYQGSGSYSGNLPLENGQRVHGESHGLTADAVALVPADPGNPTLGAGLALAQNNTIQGVNLAGPLTGTSVGTATMNTATSGQIVNTAGNAADIAGGTLNMTFTAVSSSGSGTDGIRLNNTSGTFSASAGAIQNATGEDVEISGSNTVNFTYGGSISDTTGTAVSVANQTGGTKDFNGSVSGASVTLASNTGATIRFDGGTTLSAGAANALSATGGGTLAVTGAANTLATTTGTALNVQNTAIHDDDLTFRSISASDPSTSGIAVNTTSNASGRLVVTGSSAGVCGGNVSTGNAGGAFTAPTVTNPSTGDCTGGTIASAGTHGVALSSVPGGVSLTRMRVNGAADDGINASSVGNGIVLDHVLVDGNGDAAADRGVEFTSVTGTSAITQSSVTGSADDNVNWENNGTSTLGLTVANSRFADNSAVTGADGLLFRGGTGNPTMTASIHDNAFIHNRDDGFQLANTTPSSAQMNVTFSDNDIVQGVNNVANNDTIHASNGSDADTRFKMDNNDLTGALGSAVILNPGPDGTSASSFDGIVTNNVIGNGAADSGSVSGIGLWGRVAGNGVNRFHITGNLIQNYQSQGMYLRGNEGTGQQTSYTVTGNTIGTQDGSALVVLLEAGSVSGDSTTVCADFGGAGALANTVFDRPAGNDIGAARDIATSTLNLVNYAGGDLTTYFTGRNTPNTITAVQSGTTPGNAGGSCALPTAPPLP